MEAVAALAEDTNIITVVAVAAVVAVEAVAADTKILSKITPPNGGRGTSL